MTDHITALRALLAKVEAGEWIGDLPRPTILHTDLCWKAFNGSLDAGKALHQAVLPGWDWLIGSQGEAAVYFGERGPRFDAVNIHPARAWLIAILRALIEEGE